MKSRARRSFQPRLEALEDRTVPTVIAPPSGLVSWWTGDNTAADVTALNNGTLNNGVTFAPGEVASGFSFNANNYLSASTSGLPTGNGDRTIEMWVKVNSFSSGEAFFAGYGNFGTLGQTYHLGTTGSALFWSQWGDGIGGPSLTANRWYHVAVSNIGNTATLYLDGVAVGSNTVTINTPAGTSFYAGRIPGPLGDSRKLDGMTDEISVYNRALSAGEIQAIYQAGSDGKTKSPNYIAANYPSIAEGAAASTSIATFTISRVGSASGEVIVNWATANGTATAGTDYVAASGQLTFLDGQSQKTVQVTVNGDNTPEPNESFSLVLSTTTPGYGVGAGLATIVNDDAVVSVSDASATEGTGFHLLDEFVAPNSGGLGKPRNVLFGPDRSEDGADDLYVANDDSDEILLYDGKTGAFISVFVASGSGGLDSPVAMTFGPDGHLYVTGRLSDNVLRYDGTTGAFIDAFVPAGAYGLNDPRGIVFDENGDLYVSTRGDAGAPGPHQVLRFQGPAGALPGAPLPATGQTGAVFVADGSGGLAGPSALAFGPDGNLYVGSNLNNSVNRYDASTGAFIDVFIPSGSGGLLVPAVFTFRDDGYFYVTSQGSSRVLRYHALTGAFVDAIVPDSGENGTNGLAFDADGYIYVASSLSSQVLRYGPSTLAAFTVRLSIPSATAVTVNFTTAAGSAAAGSDYTTTSGTLTFAPGQTARTVLVQTNDDAATELAETFTLNLSNAVGAIITDGIGVATILDNDTKFYVVDDATSNRTYEYGSGGIAAENYALNAGNAAPRGAASIAAGTIVWVVDANKKVYVYNSSGGLHGSWTAGGLHAQAQIEGIATNGTDIWLVDNKQDKVFKFTGAASRLSGSQNADSSFNLASGNTDPKDLVTDGVSLWVVNDSSTNKVFKYNIAGTLAGSWTIDAANATPTGITLDPSSPQHLWIVDSGTDRVYQYDNAVSRTSGSQSASTSFALAAGNTNPQGIADPPSSNGEVPSAPVQSRVTALQAQPVPIEALNGWDGVMAESLAVETQITPAMTAFKDRATIAVEAMKTEPPSPAMPVGTQSTAAFDRVFAEDGGSWLDLPSSLEGWTYRPLGRKK